MTPEYLEELAQRADPQQLWRLAADAQMDLPPDERRQLDTAVALRRHASHIRELNQLLAEKRSLLITPLGPNETAVRSIETPPDHARLYHTRGPERPIVRPADPKEPF